MDDNEKMNQLPSGNEQWMSAYTVFTDVNDVIS